MTITSRQKRHSDRSERSVPGRRAFDGRAFLIWLLILFLVAAAAFFGDKLYGWAAVLLILLLPLISHLLARTARGRLKVWLDLPVTSPKKLPFSGTAALTSKSLLPIRRIDLPLTITNDLTGETQTVTLGLTAPAARRTQETFRFTSAHCGQITFAADRVLLYDWFGFWPLSVPVKASRPITILPETFESDVQIRLPHTEPGETDSWYQIKGEEDPTELFALRDYVPGDPVRRMHWKLTAKRDTPIVKDISRPIDQSLLLFWDKRSPNQTGETAKTDNIADDPGAAPDSLAESLVSVALSLAGQNIPFTLGWLDGEGLHYEDVTSEEEVLKAIPLLVRTRPDDSDSLPSEIARVERFSKVLWFTERYPRELEASLPYETTVLLCSEDNDAAGALPVIRFESDEIREVFTVCQL